jgi:hypothetical protein
VSNHDDVTTEEAMEFEAMEFDEFRAAVLNEILKLITDKTIEVAGHRIVVKTHLSAPNTWDRWDYWVKGPTLYDDDPHGVGKANFATFSPESLEPESLKKNGPVADYGWRIELRET